MADMYELQDAVSKLKGQGHQIGQLIVGPDTRIEIDGKAYSPDEVIRMANEPTHS